MLTPKNKETVFAEIRQKLDKIYVGLDLFMEDEETMTSKKSKSSKPSNVKKGFACLKCGYEAYKLAALSHCPLCIRCK